MATKCVVLGENKGAKQYTPIVFLKCVMSAVSDLRFSLPCDPAIWDNVELVSKGREHFYDLMFAYNDNDRESGYIYLGYWNDGFVN